MFPKINVCNKWIMGYRGYILRFFSSFWINSMFQKINLKIGSTCLIYPQHTIIDLLHGIEREQK